MGTATESQVSKFTFHEGFYEHEELSNFFRLTN
jgi:hypothetical protein